ncbi:hypothetical protein RIF29_24813 [Crotalaria pallida]|uniref:Uncharacterized protein n=1 Tax=Crotalaria pallida TaxID=3830 RepID=A0AAN9EL50_CROPI
MTLTHTSSLRFNSFLLSSNPTSSSSSSSATYHTHNLSFPSPVSSKFVGYRKITQKSAVKAEYDNEFWAPGSQRGIWSIRDDLQVPSSPYFPAYAQGQGPPPMVQERFGSVISQLFQYRII